PPAPASSSSAAGSPPGFASHAFSAGPSGARGPQPIIPLNSTPAPRSPVHYTSGSGASRSPTAPYPIYGAGSLTGRRSPDFTVSICLFVYMAPLDDRK
ncbi:hypothetical protein FRC12_023202, partial [Ceratobasidium sp. 428]